MVEGEEMVLKKTIFTNIIKTLPKSNKKGGKLSPLTATFLRASGGKMSVRVGSRCERVCAARFRLGKTRFYANWKVFEHRYTNLL